MVSQYKAGSFVDFSLTDEQVLLRESVEKYVADHGGVERHRKLSQTEAGFDPGAWSAFADLGWLALPFSEDDGGLGGSATDLMVLCESLGRGVVREPYLHTVITCGGLLAGMGNAEQRNLHLQPLMEGKTQWAFAYAEQTSGYDLTAIETAAIKDGAGYSLIGHKVAVFNGHIADRLLVTAAVGDGLSLFIVDPGMPGVTREAFTAVDGSRGAVIRFDSVQLGGDCLVGEIGAAQAGIDAALDRALVAIGADALGAMQVLLGVTVEYCKTREQFGQPIGKFQALQHRMADMYLKLEESRSLLYNAAIQLDEGSADAPAACSALKVKLAEAGRAISYESVQLHGGMGMTDELIVGHLFKRLLLLSKLYGDEHYYLDRYLQLQAA